MRHSSVYIHGQGFDYFNQTLIIRKMAADLLPGNPDNKITVGNGISLSGCSRFSSHHLAKRMDENQQYHRRFSGRA